MKTNPAAIARITEHMTYRADELALALIDFDRKRMPPDIAAKIEVIWGLWGARVLAELEQTARIVCSFMKAGLNRANTAERFAQFALPQLYLGQVDVIRQVAQRAGTSSSCCRAAADVERFLTVLHASCQLKIAERAAEFILPVDLCRRCEKEIESEPAISLI